MIRISAASATGWVAVATSCLLWADPASAASHLWRFSEFYSSPDRKIQFIEMKEIGGSDNELAIANHWFATNSYNLDHSELLGSDLEPPTAYRNFLVGTESYAALPDVPQPDYVLPDGIIDPSGDTVVWWFYQTIEIPPGVMPSDGVLSITVDDPVLPTYTVGVNSPTNLAGDTGTVVLAPAVPAGRGWGVPLGLLLVGTGMLSIAYRRRAH
jgi:hypothetical protein